MMAAATAESAPRVDARLKITEIFRSLQGESSRVGLPTVFVRLTGCPLRCQYCDTAYAFHGGEWMSLDQIASRLASEAVHQICVTGGEPLAQKSCLNLLARLCDEGYSVSLETSGALPIDGVDARVNRVVDIKTPDSGECTRNLWRNLEVLTSRDEVKFVLCSRADYDWALQIIAQFQLAEKCSVLLSPSFDQLAPRELADWIVQDRAPVRMQLQLHKILWAGEAGR